MRSRIETLEGRTLLSGGVVRSYGTAGSASFANEIHNVTLSDSALDPQGRMVLVGYGTLTRDAASESRMFVARLNRDGTLDRGFAGDGINSNTPRGVRAAFKVLPLRAGGYVLNVSGNTAGGTGFLKLGDDGFTDSSWGNNGITAGAVTAKGLFEQADGSITVIGRGQADQWESDPGFSNYVARLSSRGKLDKSLDAVFSEGSLYHRPDGLYPIGNAAESDSVFSFSDEITSVSMDNAGRLLVTKQYWGTFHGDSLYNPQQWRASLTIDRREADAVGIPRIDSTFRFAGVGEPQVQVYDQPLTETYFAARTGVAVARGDGAVAISRNGNDSRGIIVTTINPTSDGKAVEATRSFDLSAALPGLSMPVLSERVILPLKDGSSLLAGAASVSGKTVPAVVKMRADGVLDTTFGVGGLLRVPAGAQDEVAALHLAPDGAIVAVVDSSADRGDRELRTSLILRDDKPIVSVESVRRKGDQYRVAVTVRGLSGINLSSLGSNDLRAVDGSGRRVALRLVGATLNADGTVSATYRVNRASLAGAASWTLRAQSNAIVDLAGRGVDGRAIGSILL